MNNDHSEPENNSVDGVMIPQSLLDTGEVNASELSNELLDLLLKRTASFIVRAVNDQGLMVQRLEQRIEERGLTCRVYTENRAASLGVGALVPGIGWAAAAAMAVHNIATWSPDYEIGKNKIGNRVTVACKKAKENDSSGAIFARRR